MGETLISRPALAPTRDRDNMGLYDNGEDDVRALNRLMSRRAALFGVSAAFGVYRSRVGNAEFIEPVSNAEKLLYATVRIVGKNATGNDVGGTAFFFRISLEHEQVTHILITNKHVVRDNGPSRPLMFILEKHHLALQTALQH